jgi:Holliday junction resolvasome RuvABC endonuclease subunit
MIVMGVDCASKKTGIAIMRGDKLIYHELYNSELPPNAKDQELAYALKSFRHRLAYLGKIYKIKKIVVELTGVQRNTNTLRLLAYFEAIVVLVAMELSVEIERVRTTSVRKSVLGSGNIDKKQVVANIIDKYGKMSEDEAEAVVFALRGNSLTL